MVFSNFLDLINKDANFLLHDVSLLLFAILNFRLHLKFLGTSGAFNFLNIRLSTIGDRMRLQATAHRGRRRGLDATAAAATARDGDLFGDLHSRTAATVEGRARHLAAGQNGAA